MATIPNFLNNYQSPLGAAFKNLIGAVAAAPSDADNQVAADKANEAHWALQGKQKLADLFSNAFSQPEAGAAMPAPAVSVPAPGASFPATAPGASFPATAPGASFPATAPAAPSPIAGRIAQLAPQAQPGPAPAPMAAVSPPNSGAASPITQAFTQTAPQAAPQAAPQHAPMDYGQAINAAIYAGVNPKDLGGYNLFGAANDFGATDQRTQNAQVGDGQSYENTFGALDRKQNDSVADNLRTQDTSRANNADTNATSRANNSANISKDYGIAKLHENAETARSEAAGNLSAPTMIGFTGPNGEEVQVAGMFDKKKGQYVDAATGQAIHNPQNLRIIGNATGGGRSVAMAGRVATAALDAASDIQNLSGIGTGAGMGLFSNMETTPLAALQRTITPQQVQDTQTTMAGLSRAMSLLGSGGMQGSDTVMKSFDSLQPSTGDSMLTTMRKLGSFRQQASNGIDSALASPLYTPAQKKQLQDAKNRIQTAIPWEPGDVQRLENAGHSGMSMHDVYSQKLGKTGAPAVDPDVDALVNHYKSKH